MFQFHLDRGMLVLSLPSKAREPPAEHLIVPFLLNTFILSEVAALNN